MLEPWETGLSTSGNSSPSGSRALGSSTTQSFAVAKPTRSQARLAATLSNASRLTASPQPVYGTPSTSSLACTVPSSPYVPCSARNTTSVSGGRRNSPSTGSISVTRWPKLRSASATAAPDWSDTSRSPDGPPSITQISSGSITPRLPSADDLHLGLQLNAALGLRALADAADQAQHIVRRRAAVVDDEIAVLLRHHRAALARTL